MTDPGQANTFTPTVTPPTTGCVDPTQFFSLLTAWQDLPPGTEFRAGRASVANGEKLFNTKQFQFPGVPGTFTCTGCHLTTDIGNFPFVSPNHTDFNASLFIRLGLDSPDFLAHVAGLDARVDNLVRRTEDLPVYSLSLRTEAANCGPAILPNLTTGQPMLETLRRSTDPGRALVTGMCADLGAFKPPTLCGVAARAPYFHNGAAATIDDVVNYYNAIFRAGLSQAEHDDLVAFLRSLSRLPAASGHVSFWNAPCYGNLLLNDEVEGWPSLGETGEGLAEIITAIMSSEDRLLSADPRARSSLLVMAACVSVGGALKLRAHPRNGNM